MNLAERVMLAVVVVFVLALIIVTAFTDSPIGAWLLRHMAPEVAP